MQRESSFIAKSLAVQCLNRDTLNRDTFRDELVRRFSTDCTANVKGHFSDDWQSKCISVRNSKCGCWVLGSELFPPHLAVQSLCAAGGAALHAYDLRSFLGWCMQQGWTLPSAFLPDAGWFWNWFVRSGRWISVLAGLALFDCFGFVVSNVHKLLCRCWKEQPGGFPCRALLGSVWCSWVLWQPGLVQLASSKASQLHFPQCPKFHLPQPLQKAVWTVSGLVWLLE